jgi:hypothetical protein
MSAKQFEHFLQFHQQLASIRRATREAVPSDVAFRRGGQAASAKEWLAGMSRSRPYSRLT